MDCSCRRTVVLLETAVENADCDSCVNDDYQVHGGVSDVSDASDG